MPNIADYFNANRYKPNWFIGDRVEGKWNKIPFVGTVLNDGLVNEEMGPKVSVQLDLPIAYKNEVLNIIHVKPKELNQRK